MPDQFAVSVARRRLLSAAVPGSYHTEASPWNDTEACAKAIVLWYKSQGAGQDYEYDHLVPCKVIQGLSDRSKEKLSEDRIRQIVSDGLSSWRTFITCEEMKSPCA